MLAQYTVVALRGHHATLHHYYVEGPDKARAMARAALPADAVILGVLPYWQEWVAGSPA